jgi:LDH2 family malate/lactate/ureidoglycolate dehydrogenase
MSEDIRVMSEPLKSFCIRIFQTLEVGAEDAAVVADNLVAADLRGIASHGVARLRRYVKGIQTGTIMPRARIRVEHETAATALLDGGGGLGQPISSRAMKMAIQKAKEAGAGFVTVRNSNHYGIAGYYAMMALEHDMIGISMTNSGELVVPTFGRNSMLGTNPISVAAPAGEERPFVLDMATSTVPRGKLEVYNRHQKPMPRGWATDESGEPTPDASRVLNNLENSKGGGLLPLGGAGELFSGHKGFGLALMVDILSGVLPGAGYANNIYTKDPSGKPKPADVGHFFGALSIDGFRPAEDFKQTMDDIIIRLRNTPKASGQDRIYIHGEKEFEIQEDHQVNGVILHPKVGKDLKSLALEQGVEYDLNT